MKLVKIFLLLPVIWILGCSKQSERLNVAKNLGYSCGQSLTEYGGIFNNLYKTAEALELNNYQTLAIGKNVKFKWIDSLFNDGNGIVFQLQYPAMGIEKPAGFLGADAKFRAGVWEIMMSKKWSQDSVVFSIVNVGAAFQGNGFDMFNWDGKIEGQKINANNIILNGSLKMQRNKEEIMQINPQIKIEVKQGFKTYSGEGTGLAMDQSSYQFNVQNPLKQEDSCGAGFVNGLLKISDNNYQASLDFNPYQTEACDRRVRTKVKHVEEIFYLY